MTHGDEEGDPPEDGDDRAEPGAPRPSSSPPASEHPSERPPSYFPEAADGYEEEEEEELDERPSSRPDPFDDDRPGRRRRRLERLLPDVLKRAIERGIESGLGTLTNASGQFREVAHRTNEAAQGLPKELSSVPKEVAGYVFSQIDDTKNAMVRVVAREVREFLEAADIAKELHRALTSLSFEIKTEIRFIPNDAGGVKPDVRAAVSPKRHRRGSRRPSAAAAERRQRQLDEEADDES